MRVLRARRFVLAALALCALPGRAPAKEHTAGCAELPAMIGRVRASLEAATGQRQRGSSLGAYQVLRATTASMVRDSAQGRCGALGATLSAALRRASASHTALDASVELDLGLDAVMSLATDGHLPYSSAPPKVPLGSPIVSPASSAARPIGEAALYGQDCPDLFPLTQRLEGPASGLPDRVKALLRDLGAHPRCARVRQLLERAPNERLAHTVDSISLDEADEPPPSDSMDVLTRCPELPQVIERLSAAIEVGAPQYNAGDPDACRRTYEIAARSIPLQVLAEDAARDRCPGVRVLLAAGLARAESSSSPNEAAWALRHSFDAILASQRSPAP